MPSIKERLADARERRPLLDHLLRTFEHYGDVRGNALAAAVTYFAFLSFFPILALAFAIIGQVSKAYPDAEEGLVKAIEEVLPGMVGSGGGQISLADLQDAAPSIFSVGLLIALYSGLGWLSGMREALTAVFEEPERERPNFVMGKLRDLLALAVLGSVLMSSVAISGVVTRFTGPILEFVGLDEGAGLLVWLVAVLLGLAASAVLFFAFFKLLASPEAPNRSLWSGALLGAIGFELLKQLSSFLLQSTKGQPAFQAFGIALILLVWMNYFSRVVVLAAAWAHTTRAARAIREARLADEQAVKGPAIDVPTLAAAGGVSSPASRPWDPEAAFVAGAAAMLALVRLVRRRR
jgi:membrane protein